jgi:2-iminobutanoate/2-iminopropanoate deaminase
MEKISTAAAYESSAPLSQAIRHDGIIYLSGAVPLDSDTGELPGEGVEEQTRQVLENLEAVLEAADSSMDDVVRARVFLTDMDAFGELNGVYEEFFSAPYPARTAVRAEMASPEIKVEIDLTAAVE